MTTEGRVEPMSAAPVDPGEDVVEATIRDLPGFTTGTTIDKDGEDWWGMVEAPNDGGHMWQGDWVQKGVVVHALRLASVDRVGGEGLRLAARKVLALMTGRAPDPATQRALSNLGREVLRATTPLDFRADRAAVRDAFEAIVMDDHPLAAREYVAALDAAFAATLTPVHEAAALVNDETADTTAPSEVVTVHKPQQRPYRGKVEVRCAYCGQPWPCPFVPSEPASPVEVVEPCPECGPYAPCPKHDSDPPAPAPSEDVVDRLAAAIGEARRGPFHSVFDNDGQQPGENEALAEFIADRLTLAGTRESGVRIGLDASLFPHRGSWRHANWCSFERGDDTSCTCGLDYLRRSLNYEGDEPDARPTRNSGEEPR